MNPAIPTSPATIPTVQFLRVLGIRSHTPVVLAAVDGYQARWRPQDGWTCQCPGLDGDTCWHVDTVASLLDDRVTGGDHR